MGDKSESFTPCDSADCLTGIGDVAAYLEAAIDEASDDPAFIAQTLGPSLAPATSASWRAGSA